VDWLTLNWYLVIPWVTGLGAWSVAWQRRVGYPIRWGLIGFLAGSLIVLAIDLTQV
jgi:hypothetical protein